jgi:SAM-dependent methyltransferase
VTLSAEEQRIAARHCESVLIHDLDLGLPRLPDGPFRIVILSHLLEHLRDPHSLLRGVRGVLTPDGVIAVALPNVLYWSQRVRFVLGQFEYSETGIMDYTHLRFYTYESGRRLLADCGYTILRQTVEGFVPFPFRRALRCLPLGPINHLFSRLAPGFFGWQLLYVARPRVVPGCSNEREAVPHEIYSGG